MNAIAEKSNTLRKDIIELVYRSAAGHVGGDLSVIDILNVLYNRVMNVSPDNAASPDRDRFVLSKAHCADALFLVLADKGFFPKEEVIETFSRFGTRFLGHPNKDIPGVEICGGSLGHGLSVAVGMALAAKSDKRDYRTYVVLGDGEMAEGSNFEAMMAAAHYKLDNLCATVDLNGLQISGKTSDVMNSFDLSEKFKSFGWNVIVVQDGNDCNELEEAYKTAATFKGKPTVVIAHTVKGKGVSFMEDAAKWHHGELNEEQYKKAMQELGGSING